MEGFYLALGVTVVLPFLQWAFPAIPRIIAVTGVVGGVTVMFAEFLDPAMKPPFPVVILFLIGILCIGGAAHLYTQFLKAPKPPEASAVKPPNQEMTAQAAVAQNPVPTQTPKVEPTPSPSGTPRAGAVFLDAEDSQNITINGGYIGGADTGFKLKRVDGFVTNDTIFDRNQSRKSLPPPPPEFAALSNEILSQAVGQFCKELRDFRAGFDRQRDAAYSRFAKATESSRGMDHDRSKAIWISADNELKRERARLDELEKDEFVRQYLPKSISLASAVVMKTGPIQIGASSSTVRQGATIISTSQPVGPQVEEAVAQFLTEMAGKLQQ